jgi:hypothetical protein
MSPTTVSRIVAGQLVPERPFNVRVAKPWHGDAEMVFLRGDHIPRVAEMRWRERDGHYVRELDECVFYLSHCSDGQGFHGASFVLPMEDGSQRTEVGPMSGAAEFLNPVFPELGGVVEAVATESDYTLIGNHGGDAVKITASRLAEIHGQFPELAEQRRAAIAERDREIAEHNARCCSGREAER